MSRIDITPLFGLLLLALFSCACFAEELQTFSERGFSEQGIYQGRSLRLVQDSGAYLGGTLADWRTAPESTTRISGLFVGYRSDGPVAVDIAVGGYSEIDPNRPHPVEELLPRSLGSLGKVAFSVNMNRNLQLGLGGLYLKAQKHGEHISSTDRVIGQAHLDYRFF